ncbi:vitamin K epoxide reductase [Candidatus Mancarchaeum acidiphilum]|uniref:Vitamin K epoxide reductase n=2 Tax=Candidatus Mancarchaeum acidiphilum TaxID=1920749 RepID=A0A218NLM8_9ARCH|nr:vitamin K epoxide reductase [Candidatus Mancarchaeum acidiphilum]
MVYMELRQLKYILIILLIVGIVDEIYESYIYFSPKSLVCPDTGIINCGVVLSSSYATVIGIPLAILGLTWVIVALVITLYTKLQRTFVPYLWIAFGALGVAYSIIAQSLIGKICIYCTLLDTIIILSVAILYYILRNQSATSGK